MHIETARLLLTEFTMEMCEAVHLNSLDEDNRRFVPDEVFETVEEARETVAFLMQACREEEGPFVYPVLRKTDGANIGYMQACRLDHGFEVGYHIAKPFTGRGYATEALKAFAPAVMDDLHISSLHGIVLEENLASCRVLEKSGFQLVFRGRATYQGKEQEVRKYLYTK